MQRPEQRANFFSRGTNFSPPPPPLPLEINKHCDGDPASGFFSRRITNANRSAWNLGRAKSRVTYLFLVINLNVFAAVFGRHRSFRRLSGGSRAVPLSRTRKPRSYAYATTTATRETKRKTKTISGKKKKNTVFERLSATYVLFNNNTTAAAAAAERKKNKQTNNSDGKKRVTAPVP